MLFFKSMGPRVPRFQRPPRVEVTGELAKRLTQFEPEVRYANYAEVDRARRLIRIFQTETAFSRRDPLVMRWEEFCGYQLWEDGFVRSRQDLGYAYPGESLPEGQIVGTNPGHSVQKIPRKYVFKRYLLLYFSYRAPGDTAVCLDLISLRTQTESAGYRASMASLHPFLDFLDAVQAGIPLSENMQKEAIP